MSNYEDKPGNITIFRNDKATPENKQPEYQGYYLNQNGEKCDVALWVRTASQSGRKFFSGQVKFEPFQPSNQNQSQPQPDDDVPF